MRREARAALDEIGINIPSLNAPVARLSGGQRQAIAVARTVHSEADILLLDEPLAAMGAKEGALILDLIERLKAAGEVSIVMVLHNYVHVLASCDRVNLIQDGVDRARQADGGDLGRGADRDRRRGVPPGPPGGDRAGGGGDDLRRRRRLRHALGARASWSGARDGAELGLGRARVRARGHGPDAAATGAALPPQWALQDPED